MGKVTLRPPAEGDVEFLAPRLRAADHEEVAAASGRAILPVLRDAVRTSSHCTVAVEGGEPVAIFGLAPLSLASGVAAPWMLGTDRLGALPCSLARTARRYVAEARRLYPVLENWVDDRNAPSIALLQWLGFDLDEPAPFGPFGLAFRRFHMRGRICASRRPTEQRF